MSHHKHHPKNKPADTKGEPAPKEPPPAPHRKRKVILIAVGGVTIFTLTIAFPQIIHTLEYYMATGYYGHHFFQLLWNKRA
jgi:hypothetical protein